MPLKSNKFLEFEHTSLAEASRREPNSWLSLVDSVIFHTSLVFSLFCTLALSYGSKNSHTYILNGVKCSFLLKNITQILWSQIEQWTFSMIMLCLTSEKIYNEGKNNQQWTILTAEKDSSEPKRQRRGKNRTISQSFCGGGIPLKGITLPLPSFPIHVHMPSHRSQNVC